MKKQKNKYANTGRNQQEQGFNERSEGKWNGWSQWIIKILLFTSFIIMWKAASNEELREVARYLLQKRTEQIWFKILYISAGIGFAITIWCIKVVQRNHGHMFLTGLQKDELMVNGVFKYTRNPFYLTQVILYVPALLTFFSFWGSYFTIICTIGLSLYLFFIYLTIREEEKRLEAKYGPKYLDYKKATPRFLPRDWLGFLREARFPTKQKSEPAK